MKALLRLKNGRISLSNCSEVKYMKDKTMLFQIESKDSKEVQKVLKEVYRSLKERGYNPTDQIVGYLISGDLGYISSYQDARRKMQSLDRSKVVEVLLDNFLRG